MSEITFHLRDINAPLVAAWSHYFADIPQVQPSVGNISGVTADAIISPANSFGFMDGGIDLVYSRRFGWQLQERLQKLLRDEYDGELPVGMAVLLGTDDPGIPYLISAPTMRPRQCQRHAQCLPGVPRVVARYSEAQRAVPRSH